MKRPVCLVTGASGYVGAALCAALSPHHDVVAQYHSRVPQLASQLRRSLHSGAAPVAEPSVYCVRADLMDPRDMARLVEITLARHDVIDHVINCAADVRFHGRVLELAQFDGYVSGQLELNAVVPLRLVSCVFDLCWKDDAVANRERGRSVVNISSGSSLYALPDTRQAIYGASKAALNLLTLYAASELAPYNVRANVVCPGALGDDARLQQTVAAILGLISGDDTGELVRLC